MTTVTQWFSDRPVHKGVYEINKADADGRCFAYWNGVEFTGLWWQHSRSLQTAINRCYRDRGNYFNQSLCENWRGLVVKP